MGDGQNAMMLRLSIKSVLRTPLKTVLFLLLIGAGIASLCLGIGMWESADRLLENADETYTTVAYVEYVGENYPDTARFDTHMVEELKAYDATPLLEQEPVLAADRQAILGGMVKGLQLGTRGTTQFYETGVFRFRVIYVKEDHYVCMITGDPLFVGSYYKDGLFFHLYYEELKAAGIEPATLQKDEYYYTIGTFYEGENRAVCCRILPCTLNVGAAYRELAALPLTHVTDAETFRDTFAYSFYFKAAETYRVLTNHLRVYASDYPEQELAFFLRETELVEGAFYAPNEGNVCLISEYLRDELELQVGDTLTLDLYKATEDSSAEGSYWYDDGFLTEQSYRVVGIYRNATGLYSTVYIPKTETEWMPKSSIDYTVCRVTLKNDGVEGYRAAIKPYLLGNMRVTVYDQGYANVKKAIDSMSETARLLTYVCAAVTLSLLLLFGWLFLLKQRESARIMLNLGTGRRKTLCYLFLSAAMVLLLAGILGGLFGGMLSEQAIVSAYQNAVSDTVMDVRFSSLATQGEVLNRTLAPSLNQKAVVLTSLGCVLAGLLVSGIFFVTTLRKFRPVRRKEKNPQKRSIPEATTQTVSFEPVQLSQMTERPNRSRLECALFPIRLVLRSIFRNRGKSIIVPLVSLVMVLFLGFFVADMRSYEKRLNEVYTDLPVTAYVTNYSGRHIDNLILTEYQLKDIVDLGYVSETYYTQKLNYLFMEKDVSVTEEIPLPEEAYYEGYAAETFAEKVSRGAYLIGTNHIETAPEFYFTGEPLLTFMEGYDASLFEGEEPVCLANQAFLDEQGLKLGDTVSILVGDDSNETMLYKTLGLTVVGTYPANSGRDNLYCPLAVTEGLLLRVEIENVYRDLSGYRRAVHRAEQGLLDGTFTGDPSGEVVILDNYAYQYGPDGVLYMEQRLHQKYHSAQFLLKDTKQMDGFKQGLSELGYLPVGQLGRIRRTVVINETNLVETVDSIQSHIRYMKALFVVFEVLSVAIGFVVSYLLTKNRRAEFAMMRSQGAGRGRTFFTFALEQFLLSLFGCALGAGMIALLYGTFSAQLWEALLLYVICYLVGILIAAGMMNRARVLEILSVKE